MCRRDRWSKQHASDQSSLKASARPPMDAAGIGAVFVAADSRCWRLGSGTWERANRETLAWKSDLGALDVGWVWWGFGLFTTAISSHQRDGVSRWRKFFEWALRESWSGYKAEDRGLKRFQDVARVELATYRFRLFLGKSQKHIRHVGYQSWSRPSLKTAKRTDHFQRIVNTNNMNNIYILFYMIF